MTEFAPLDENWDNLSKLQTRKFREGMKSHKEETLVAYYYSIVDLCKKVDNAMSESMKVKYLLNGLPLHLRNHLALLNLTTSEEVLQKFKVLKPDLTKSPEDPHSVLAMTEDHTGQETGEVNLATTAGSTTQINVQQLVRQEIERQLSTQPVTQEQQQVVTRTFVRGGSNSRGRGRGNQRGQTYSGTRGAARGASVGRGRGGDIRGTVSTSDTQRTETGVPICEFCGRTGHNEYRCFDRKRARKEARERAGTGEGTSTQNVFNTEQAGNDL